MDIQSLKADINTVCDERYADLYGYTVDDVRNIAIKLRIPFQTADKKSKLCYAVSNGITLLELEDQVEALLASCQETLAKFQSTAYLKRLEPKKSCQLVTALIQQVLWLLDRHVELANIRKQGVSKEKLLALAATISGQCRQANSIFNSMGVPRKLNRSWW